jgi:hypothetical protein
VAVEDVADAFFGDVPDLVWEKGLVGSLTSCYRRKQEGETEKKSVFKSSQGPAIIEICMRRRKFAKRNDTTQHQNQRANTRNRPPKKPIHKNQKPKHETLRTPKINPEKKLTRICLSSAPVAKYFPSGLKHTLRIYRSLPANSSVRTLCVGWCCVLVLVLVLVLEVSRFKGREFEGKVEFTRQQ